MENINQLLHDQFKLGKNATEAARNINEVIGREVVNKRTAQEKFKQLREGRTSLQHKKGAGRPPTIDKKVLAQRFRRNPNASTRELSQKICSHSCTRPVMSKWIPHRLTPKEKKIM